MSLYTGKTFHKSTNAIKSLQEFFSHVEYAKENIFKTHNIWFRGVASKKYKLIPNVYRDDISANEELEMRYDFKDKAKGFINYSGLEDFEWYFLMQHFGLKTRLLDWTEGYLIALFFALKLGPKDIVKSEDPCVWLINPSTLNSMTLKTEKLIRTEYNSPDDHYNVAKKYLNLNFNKKNNEPIAISASYSNERILRQKGCFTLHGDDNSDIYSVYKKHKNNELCKIEIDRKSVNKIKLELLTAGISESSIFPDLEGLSREINSKYGKN